MNAFLLTTITGLISGIVSSLIFFWIMSMLRPSITLSGEICKSVDNIGTFYGFKLLNNSIFNVLDVKVEVILKTPFNSNGGLNHSMRWIQLRKDSMLLFPRYKKKDVHADYALIVATRDDLESLWTDQAQFLEIKVHGKHSFSGISKSFTLKYYTKKNCIKDGMFNFGRTFDIS